MNIHLATVAELTALKARGAQWLGVVKYAHKGHQRGDILSRHRGYDAANRKYASNGFVELKELDDVIREAQITDNTISVADLSGNNRVNIADIARDNRVNIADLARDNRVNIADLAVKKGSK